jgi:hypothetical protein
MIIYEVTTTVAGAAIERYEAFMRDRHIPDVMATGCFTHATITRSMAGRYRITYLTTDLDVLDRYLRTYAPQLRADFAAHLGTTVDVTREVWTELQSWTGAVREP